MDLFGIVLFGFWVYCIIDVLLSDPSQVRSLSKWAWLAIVVLVFPVFPIGGVMWLAFARPPRFASGESMSERRERYAARPRPQMPRRSRPAPADQPVDEAVIRARIEERDRLLARWEEEDRLKGDQPGRDQPADRGPDGP